MILYAFSRKNRAFYRVSCIILCGIMRLTISLACKGEIVERITSEASNMTIKDLPERQTGADYERS